MSKLFLSGVGGSSNWIPLIYPLILLVIVFYGVEEWIRRLLKKRRLFKENQLIDKYTTPPATHTHTLPGQNS